MANNATNVWKWDGRTSAEWRAANWTNGSDVAVDDFPDAAADTATVNCAGTPLATCSAPTTVGTITVGTGGAGAACVENVTATTVTSAVTDSTITGGTIGTLNASSNTVISGGTIATANLSGTATATGGTITTLNLSGAAANNGATVTGVTTTSSTAVQYGTWGTEIVCLAATTFDGDNDFTAGTIITPVSSALQITLAFGAHVWAGSPVFQPTRELLTVRSD